MSYLLDTNVLVRFAETSFVGRNPHQTASVATPPAQPKCARILTAPKVTI
jgi:hypothetical protein